MLIDRGEEKSAALFFIVPQCSQPAQPEQCVALLIRRNEAYHLLACPYIPLFLCDYLWVCLAVYTPPSLCLSIMSFSHCMRAKWMNAVGRSEPAEHWRGSWLSDACHSAVTLTNQTDTPAPTHHPEHHPKPTVCSVQMMVAVGPEWFCWEDFSVGQNCSSIESLFVCMREAWAGFQFQPSLTASVFICLTFSFGSTAAPPLSSWHLWEHTNISVKY